MINNVILKRVIVVVFSTAMFTDTGIAYAFDMCKNMFGKMNQSKMEQSDFGYGSPDYGYGGPPAPSYGHTVPAYAAPHPGSDALQAEIYRLELRIKNLEEIDQLKQQIKNLEKALTHESFRPQGVPTDPGTG